MGRLVGMFRLCYAAIMRIIALVVDQQSVDNAPHPRLSRSIYRSCSKPSQTLFHAQKRFEFLATVDVHLLIDMLHMRLDRSLRKEHVSRNSGHRFLLSKKAENLLLACRKTI